MQFHAIALMIAIASNRGLEYRVVLCNNKRCIAKVKGGQPNLAICYVEWLGRLVFFGHLFLQFGQLSYVNSLLVLSWLS